MFDDICKECGTEPCFCLVGKERDRARVFEAVALHCCHALLSKPYGEEGTLDEHRVIYIQAFREIAELVITERDKFAKGGGRGE